MSQRYPCPNSACVHEFTPADLVGATTLTCPQCGIVIQLRVQPTAVSTAPSAAVPMARPVANPAIEVSHTSSPISAGDFAEPIVRQRPRRSRDWLTVVLPIGLLMLLTALGIVGMMVRGWSFNKIFGGGGFRNSDFNYNFKPRVRGWDSNPAMKSALDVSQLALMRSAAADAYFAIDVIDYKDHTPSVRELNDEARRKLKSMFPKVLETDPPADAPPVETAGIAGQTTYRFSFQGEFDQKLLNGEVAFFGNQGLGYWFYSLASGDGLKALEKEFAELRKSFSLLGERPDWSQVQKQRVTFKGDSITGYRLADATGRWKKDNDPKAHDPAADLVLRADDPANPRRPVLGADLIVMSLKRAEDPIAATKMHILAKHERDAYPNTKIGESGDAVDRVGETPGHLLRWRVNNGGGRERFAMVGIVPRRDDLLVLYAECAWDRRFNWELQLQKLIESLELID